MIIVSQDKEAVVTYENIEVLGIGNPLENNNGLFAIIANAITDNQYILGEYTTKERAKEVLREIAYAYANVELLKIPKMDFKEVVTSKQFGNLVKYEMPKE